MMGPFRVRYYADSLGLPRKNQVKNEQRYISVLLDWWKQKLFSDIEYCDRARAEQTIDKINSWSVEDIRYYGDEVDVVILHEGVVDCAPRPLPGKLRKLVSMLPGNIRNIVIRSLHNNRPRIQKLGIKFTLVKQNDFFKQYMNFLETTSGISKRVYVINIAPTNDRTENHSPGFTKNIQIYNTLIYSAINQINKPNIFLIDINTIINESIHHIDELVIPEDGHHITPITQGLIAQAIMDNEEKYLA